MPKLPPFVVLKGKKPKKGQPDTRDWFVRRVFATDERDEKGRIKYVQISRKCVPPTKERAREVSLAIEAMVRQPKPHTQSTLGEFAEMFLKAKAHHVKRRTFEHYEYLYNRHIKNSFLALKPLNAIEPMHVHMFYSSLNVSPSRISKVHMLLSMIFNQAMAWRVVTHSPTTGAMLPKFTPRETAAFTPTEARAFIKACRTRPEYIVFEFMLETGLRPQEALVLTWGDIDLNKRTVRIDKALVDRLKGGGKVVEVTKTPASIRTVAFSDALKQRLILWKSKQGPLRADLAAEAEKPLASRQKKRGVNYKKRERHRQEMLKQLEIREELDLVFPNADGGYKAIGNLNRREFKEVLGLAKLDTKKFSIESLRHSCATLLADHVHPKKLQKRMGHARLQTTMDYYVHVDDGSASETTDKIADVLYSED